MKKILLYSFLGIGLLSVGTGTAFAEENGQKEKFMGRSWGAPHMMMVGPGHVKPEGVTDFKNLSEEERKELFEKRQNAMQEQREEWQDFIGLSPEEIREEVKDGNTIGDILEDQGKSEEDAEEFLTDQANERVDEIVDRRDLDSEQEENLRDRAITFVQKILDRWFGND